MLESETMSSNVVYHTSHHIKALFLFVFLSNEDEIDLCRLLVLHTAYDRPFNQEENPAACVTGTVR